MQWSRCALCGGMGMGRTSRLFGEKSTLCFVCERGRGRPVVVSSYDLHLPLVKVFGRTIWMHTLLSSTLPMQ